MGVAPSFRDPKGIIEKLRAGEVPLEAVEWLLVGHRELLSEVRDKLQRIKSGYSPHPFQFLEGPPGCGKSALLRIIRDVSEEQGFATCSLDVTSKGGQFTEQALLVAHVLRNVRVRTQGGVSGLDAILKAFSAGLLDSFPQDENETLDKEFERLRRLVADRMARYASPEMSVIDAAYGYICAYRAKDALRMQKTVEWLQGEDLTMGQIRNLVGADTRLDEQTAMPILRSIISILQEAGHPGLVLLVDEMVQSTNEHHASQRQRTAELVRALYGGTVPHCLVFVGATPETITDSERGLAAHPGMRSRIGAEAVPERDPEFHRYRVGRLSREEAAKVFGRIRTVYRAAYGLPKAWSDGNEAEILKELLPERDTLARDFVSGAVRKLDLLRKQRG